MNIEAISALQSQLSQQISHTSHNDNNENHKQPDNTIENSVDVVEISDTYKNQNNNLENPAQSDKIENSAESEANDLKDIIRPKAVDGEPVTDKELRIINDLKKRDAEVRKHEQAHIAASGGHSRGGASYTYEKGPDGKRYAVGGEVNIDTSEASSPEKTASKMRAVKRAALAPANPSAQDRRVASKAQMKLIEAEKMIALETRNHASELEAKDGKDNTSENSDKFTGSESNNAAANQELTGYNAVNSTYSQGGIINIST
ncbi:MAG: putative metalloprotease CJM1_0395 family protein [Planctomycetota bacterium]|jgi:hypothetical protein